MSQLQASPAQRRLLVLLVAGVVMIGLWQWAPGALDLGDGIARDRREAKRIALTHDDVVELHMDALGGDSQAYTPGRNIFRFGPPPAPPPPPPRPVPPPPPPRVAGPPPPPPPFVPKPPRLDVDLLGIFGPANRRIAVFRQSDGKTVINAMEQEVVNEKFIVHQIDLLAVDFKFVGFPDVPPERLTIEE